MIAATDLLDELRASGFGLVTGVPCSFLTPLINAVIDDPKTRYVNATNEGDAVAIACGATLGGVPGVVMFQNSGFGNAVSPLSSLATLFGIPVLIFATWRGEPDRVVDEPQHELMGAITPALFDLLGIRWELMPADPADAIAAVHRARLHMNDRGQPYAIIVPKGSIEGSPLASVLDRDRRHELATVPSSPVSGDRLDPDAVLTTIVRHTAPPAVVLASTGHTGRALYDIDDRENHLYMVGSMGCVSSLGLGLALAQPNRRVVVIDGDGAFLMRMGALAAIGAEAPPNLTHLLLDNAVHESTGGQTTLAPVVDFASIAAACGYPVSTRVSTLDELSAALTRPSASLSFTHIRTDRRRGRKLPRPTTRPHDVAKRLRAFLKGTS